MLDLSSELEAHHDERSHRNSRPVSIYEFDRHVLGLLFGKGRKGADGATSSWPITMRSAC